jgi:hypothetical protein
VEDASGRRRWSVVPRVDGHIDDPIALSTPQ